MDAVGDASPTASVFDDGSDARHIGRARNGDADAFAMVMAPRLPRILRMARAILGNESDARDATQDACMSAWTSLPDLRDISKFDAWLNQLLTNRCRDLLRKRGRVREIPIDDVDVPTNDPAPEVIKRTTILAAFDRLSLADRRILALHHLDGLDVAQVAGLLGVPVGTAKSRLYAARRSLERALEGQQ